MLKIIRNTFLICACSAVCVAQSVDLEIGSVAVGTQATNMFVFAQTGEVAPFGMATLVAESSSWPITNNTPGTPAQLAASLHFNLEDSFSFRFTLNDARYAEARTVQLLNGTISGGTGTFASATGSISLTLAKDGDTSFATGTTTGSGTITINGVTTNLEVSNMRGWGGSLGAGRELDTLTGSVRVTGSLGGGNGSVLMYYGRSQPVIGVFKLNFGQDSVNILFNYVPDANGNTPATFSGRFAAGSGRYARADGPVTFTTIDGSLPFRFRVTGTLTIAAADAPEITSVRTVNGLPQIAYNTWVEIKGNNLVPRDTPAAGVDWSNAPSFSTGQMPTQLGPISVNLNGMPAYVYWYCSAATNPNCQTDQINVLGGLMPTAHEGPAVARVTRDGVMSPTFTTHRARISPAFLSFDARGHVAARHSDASLMGPRDLYPGHTTPASRGETIMVVGTGFGPPTNGPLTAGSATQSGPMLTQGISCFVGGVSANVQAALISPGLYQFNITIPRSVPSGDNLLNCMYNLHVIRPGALIAIE